STPGASALGGRFASLPVRRPPGPTLFPYTTLFRSLVHDRSDPVHVLRRPHERQRDEVRPQAERPPQVLLILGGQRRHAERGTGRSEEHTSELQSLTNLVCRLLLEKRNSKSPGLCMT